MSTYGKHTSCGLSFLVKLVCVAGLLIATLQSRSAEAKGRRMDQKRGFTFEHTARGGPELGEGLQERSEVLFVDGVKGIIRYELHRSPSNVAGEAIGRFETTLSPEAMAELRSALDSGVLAAAKPGRLSSKDSTLLTFVYETGGKQIRREMTSGDREQLGQIEMVLEQLDILDSEVCEHPKAAVQAEVRHVGSPGQEYFELLITNIGSEPIYVANPRLLGGQHGNSAWVRISVTPKETPGMTASPFQWNTMLSPKRPILSEKEARHIRIEPGKSFVSPTEPWKRPEAKGVSYTAQAIVEAYAAAPELAKEKVYLVRGGVFSKMIDVPAR